MFISNTEEQKRQMLDAIGVKEIKDLFRDIPADVAYSKISLPPALTEGALLRHMGELAGKNKKVLNFTGAGVYEHFIPSAVNAISSRGEFITAYTPYQAEASQGTLQAIYEYQSNICALFEMDVCNASHYDGATAMAEAVGAAVRIKGKNKILIPASLHPHYKKTLESYYKYAGIEFVEVAHKNGLIDNEDLKAKLEGVAAAVLATPNFFGLLEDAENISKIIKDAGVLLIMQVNPLSLGVLKTPGAYGADFAVAEGQCLGNPMYFGGPLLGVFTCKKEHIRHTPGRIAGIAKDSEGKRAFVLTLQAREQHIRRERAASNICSNQALCALNAAVYLTLMGPEGLKETAELNLDAAHKLKEKLVKAGFKIKYEGPFFNEFIVQLSKNADDVVSALAQKGIAAGYPMGELGKEFENCLLVCATETKTENDLDAYVSAMEGK